MEQKHIKPLGMTLWQGKPLVGISATTLRLLALLLMLLDHLWATIIPGNNWMTYVGRLAYPILPFSWWKDISTPPTESAIRSGCSSPHSSLRFPST